MTAKAEDVLNKITHHYLSSNGFNGVNLEILSREFELEESELKGILKSLVCEGKISLNFGSRHYNIYIKAVEAEDVSAQIEKLYSCKLGATCVYPEEEHLKSVVNPKNYTGRPFTLKLALGAPQFSISSFDLVVLEAYRNDPRYHYETDDIHGWISIKNDYAESKEFPESGKILLESFGFSYDAHTNRAVAVFLIYLSRLSPEHQQLWNTKLLPGNYTLHPEYARSVSGIWPTHVSIFKAFVEELQVINSMCEAMGKPKLFRNDFSSGGVPREFSFLIRPTAKEFAEFIHLLDKLMSENLNRDFFKGDVDLEEEITRNDGKIEVRSKGTIRLLEEWLQSRVRLQDPEPQRDMISCFKKVRKLRQKPAHGLDNNSFDQAFFREQRELIIDAYASVRTLRQILANHPRCKDVSVPKWLYEGKIVAY